MFSHLEVVALHSPLRVLDGLGDEGVFDGLVLLDAQPIHDTRYSFAAEDPQQVILQG